MNIIIHHPIRIDGDLVAAASLEGCILPGSWQVIRQLRSPDQLHGAEMLSGSTFSFGYEVVGADGKKAFLKALDYQLAFRAPDTPQTLAIMTNRYIFERELLHHLCEQRRLNRVVRVLEANSVDVDGQFQISRVDYLIFEMADGDVRSYLSVAEGIDDVWRFNCLKDVAAALAQLHSVGVAHQDTKPSNVMHFEADAISKIGDVGSATGQHLPHPELNDVMIFGDPQYSPPELLYGYRALEWGEGRLAIDLYHLGSLSFFLFGLGNATADLIDRLPIGMRPRRCQGGWYGDFKAVLPHLEHAYNFMMTEFECQMSQRLEPNIAHNLTDFVSQLCHPNPARRGHQRNRIGVARPYGLERFVSGFNLLSKKADVRLNASLHQPL